MAKIIIRDGKLFSTEGNTLTEVSAPWEGGEINETTKLNGKVLIHEGVSYRLRRGEIVEIPSEWRNRVTSKATIRQRKSKQPPAARKVMQHFRAGVAGPAVDKRSKVHLEEAMREIDFLD